MWKYIVIVALVLIAAASFVFYKTHTSLVSSAGEVATLRAEFESAINKNKEIYVDESIAAYAKLRHEWLAERKAEAEAKKAKIEEETAEIKQQVESLQQEYESSVGVAQNLKEKLEETTKTIAGLDVLKELMEKVEVEMEDMDASDPGLWDKIAANMAALNAKKEAAAAKLKTEESAVEALVARKDALTEEIADADALARERRARISPAELECFVAISDPQWDYVILDKGLDGGVIIGSRLAVMRGEKKICELNVTLVEANRSSGDIVHSTLVTGETVRPGDRVVAVRPTTKID